MPLELSSFVGRELEMEQMRALLSESRLLTLTGAGGVGKTRLALRFASGIEASGGVHVVLLQLADITRLTQMLESLANQFGLEVHAVDPVVQLAADMESARAFSILDNCEHVVAECAQFVEALLRKCANLVILATSREPLGVEGETTLRVPSLALPEPATPLVAARIGEFDAIRLLVDRARSAVPTFSLNDDNAAPIAKVCSLLDGIPLCTTNARNLRSGAWVRRLPR
jgi:non-specific serine/threonine protein kinase